MGSGRQRNPRRPGSRRPRTRPAEAARSGRLRSAAGPFSNPGVCAPRWTGHRRHPRTVMRSSLDGSTDTLIGRGARRSPVASPAPHVNLRDLPGVHYVIAEQGMAMRIRISVLAAALAVVGTIALTAPSANATAPYCGITWGSLAKVADATEVAARPNVRAGRHACFDRLVRTSPVTSTATRSATSARFAVLHWTDRCPCAGCAAGHRLPDRPTARTSRPSGTRTIPAILASSSSISGWQTFHAGEPGGGLREPGHDRTGGAGPAAVPGLRLDGPGAASRLVIDVAHRW